MPHPSLSDRPVTPRRRITALLRGRVGAARGLLPAFAATSAAHLGALLTDSRGLEQVTKPALMPLLAACTWTARTRAPALLAPALLLSAAGDTLLQVGGDTAFLAGMGSFAAAHVCYVTMFVRLDALGDRRRTALIAAAYGAGWLALVGRLWPGLGDLQAPVAVYSLLLSATAVTSAGLGLRTGIGGALFLLSDTLIATGIAGWKQLPAHEFWIMVTYIAAQYLLATGLQQADEEAAVPPAGTPATALAREGGHPAASPASGGRSGPTG